ncbi:MAG: calcium-binding protein, partial [Hyphomicrobiaceae bacterium]
LYGSRSDDTLTGGDGNDILIGGGGADLLVGGAGDDIYDLTDGADTIFEIGGGGFDMAFTNFAGTTTIMANVEKLAIFGAATGAIGSSGNDTLVVGTALGAVQLDGGDGNDELRGGQWDDRLIGGSGDDAMTGNGGSDVFDFRAAGSSADVIADFDANSAGGQDLIDVSGRGFDASSIGTTIVVTNGADGFASVAIGADTIKLLGVTTAELTAAHFIF